MRIRESKWVPSDLHSKIKKRLKEFQKRTRELREKAKTKKLSVFAGDFDGLDRREAGCARRQ